MKWEEELQKVGEQRLRASEEPEAITYNINMKEINSNFALPPNAFDNLSLLNDLEFNNRGFLNYIKY